jgi:hypothetical protein
VQKPNVIAINSAVHTRTVPPSRPHPPGSTANRPNQSVRNSILVMFALGSYPRTIAKLYKTKESDVLAEIRERIVCSGVLNERRAA